jgi:hypothetical protein
MAKRFKATDDEKNHLLRAIAGSFRTGTTANGLPYDYEIINSDGAHYELIVTPDTPDDAIEGAVQYLRSNFDVVGFRVVEVPQVWVDKMDITLPSSKTVDDILWNNRPSEILSYARLLPMEERPNFSRRAVEHQGNDIWHKANLAADLIRVDGTDTLWLADTIINAFDGSAVSDPRYGLIAFNALAESGLETSEVEPRQLRILEYLSDLADDNHDMARYAAIMRRMAEVSMGSPVFDRALDAFCGLPIGTDYKAEHALDLAKQATEEGFENAAAIVERVQRIILSSKASGTAYRFAMAFYEQADLPLIRAHVREHMHPSMLQQNLADIDNLITAKNAVDPNAVDPDMDEDINLDAPANKQNGLSQ